MDGRRDELSYTERAVIESIRRGEPDAYIAQRLGISILDVKSAVDRLMARYGKSERAGLATVPLDGDAPGGWQAPPVRGSGDDLSGEAAAPGAPPLPLERGDDEPVHSRRAVLGMIGVGAATLAGIGAYYLTGRSDSTTPARPDPFATNTPAPTATPPPTPTPHPGLGAIEPAPYAWARRSYPNGARIDVGHGIGFVDTETGDTEVLQWVDERLSYIDGWAYRVSPRNDIVATSMAGADTPGTLYRRSTGESFAWDGGALQLAAFTDELLVFQRIEGWASGIRVPVHTGTFHVVDAFMAPVVDFELPPLDSRSFHPQMAISRSGRYLASISAEGLHIVDLGSGQVATHQVPKIKDSSPGHGSLSPAPAADAFVYAGYWTSPDGDADHHYELTIDANGEITSALQADHGGWPAHMSPDGRYRVGRGTFRESYFHMGDNESWLFSELFDAESGESIFRVLSGHLWYGLQAHRRWLADSSGFLVEAQDINAPLENYTEWRQSRRHYIVRLNGELEMLPAPPLADDMIFFRWHGGPEPAPDNPELLAFGRMMVLNRATGAWLGPTAGPVAESLDPWGADSREMRFHFPIAGRGLGSIGTILPPRIERPPYRDAVTLVVAGSETCVYLRRAPSTESEALDCLPDGTRLTVVEPAESPLEDVEWGNGGITAFFGDHQHSDQMFVHVRTGSGQEGWVAIQYLHWA